MTELPPFSEAPPKQDGIGSLDRVPWLPAVISSVGAVGVLTGAGYIVQNSRDGLLGINLVTSHATTEYVALGGQFLMDTVALTWVHWVIALSGVVLIVCLGMSTGFVLHMPKTLKIQRTAWITAFIVLSILYIAKSRWLDLPYIRMSDLLEKPPVCETAAGPLRREHDIWERFLCSRHDATLRAEMKDKVGVDCSDVPGGLVESEQPTKNHVIAKAAAVLRKLHTQLTIEQEFTENIFGTALVAYLALALCLAPFLRTTSMLTATLLRILLLTMLVVDATTLPVVYGKVILPTRFPSGRIMYDGIVADPKSKVLQASPRNVACLVMASDAQFVTFYDVENNNFIQVKREKIYSIQADETADLVATRIAYYLQKSPCGSQ